MADILTEKAIPQPDPQRQRNADYFGLAPGRPPSQPEPKPQGGNPLPSLTPGEWPADPKGELPYFLSEEQLAHLLNRSVRTLQRRRRCGNSPPYTKNGKQILYPRDPALAFYMAAAV